MWTWERRAADYRVSVATVLLIRHGRTAANDRGVLAGRAPGVDLDDHGVKQSAATAERIAGLPLAAIVSSPLERCVQTAELLVKALTNPPVIEYDRGLIECGYGDWTGRELKTLAKEPLWKLVQAQPSAVTFPGGESMAEMQWRAVDAIRRRDRGLTEAHGPDALWVAVSHGDVIKAILADACGSHLDQFQRIVVQPASVSVIAYTDQRPFVVRMNDTGTAADLMPPKKRRRRRRGDATVGGGVGTS